MYSRCHRKYYVPSQPINIVYRVLINDRPGHLFQRIGDEISWRWFPNQTYGPNQQGLTSIPLTFSYIWSIPWFMLRIKSIKKKVTVWKSYFVNVRSYPRKRVSYIHVCQVTGRWNLWWWVFHIPPTTSFRGFPNTTVLHYYTVVWLTLSVHQEYLCPQKGLGREDSKYNKVFRRYYVLM